MLANQPPWSLDYENHSIVLRETLGFGEVGVEGLRRDIVQWIV